jgi:hypothetical protein
MGRCKHRSCPAPSDFDSAGWNDTTRSDRCNPNDRTHQTFRVAIPMQSRDLFLLPEGEGSSCCFQFLNLPPINGCTHGKPTRGNNDRPSRYDNSNS